MPDARLLDECVHCGFCLPACPTYQTGGLEMDSPRGRIYLMKGPLTRSAVEHLDRCLGCMGCVTACPSGVKYDALIEQTRAEIETVYKRPLGERLLRWLIFTVLPYPRRLRALRPFQRILRRFPAPRRMRPMLALMPATAPPAPLAKLYPAVGPRRARVALLAGCVQRVYFGAVNEATIRVLTAEGCEVVVPPDLGCCGALSIHAGRAAEGRRLRDRALAAIERAGVDTVAVNAAGCGSWMKEWGLGGKVKDVHELLVELGPVAPRHPLPLKVAYHDACHLAHAQRIRSQPRALLRAIPELELVEIPDGDQCCGSAGVYNLLQPESARAIGARKATNVLAAAPDLLASANPGCTLQIQMMLRDRGADLPARHPIELLDASIRRAHSSASPL